MSDSQHKKVNLFVVGAMKAGTTSFVEMLSQHPEIYVPPIKEPHYFVDDLPKTLYTPSRFFDLETYFKKQFPEPLHIAKIENEPQYEHLYSLETGENYLVDASTAYLHAPNVAQRIYDYNPNAKIIVLVRSPLERAFSHYKMDLGLGRTTASFESEISKEIDLYSNDKLPWSSYVGMSLYKNKIASYKNYFKDILILNFEEIIANRDSSMNELSDFLKVDNFTHSEATHQNKTRSLGYQKMFYFLRKIGLKDYFRKLFPQSFRQSIFKMVSSSKKVEMGITKLTQDKVEEIFNKGSV